jgi:uncharacterized protein YciI
MTTPTKRSTLILLATLLVATVAGVRAQPTGKRQQFIYVLRITPKFQEARDWTDQEGAVVTRHFERLAKATTEGQVILAGRTTEALDKTFGVVIFEAENEPAAGQFMEADPAVVSGIMSATLHPYAVALQRKP